MKTQPGSKAHKAVSVWLFIGVVMIMIMVVIGGITRLTGSGLSITEWAPILGAFPPLNEQSWQHAFEEYKQIGQYKHINSHFTLSDFKFIYFWEWFHREWGRLIGLVFLVGFVYLWRKKYLDKSMIPLLLLMLPLGVLQATIGWIMVKSGLNEENIYVNHIRLAIHFFCAMGLLVYTFWLAIRMRVPESQIISNAPLKKFSGWLLSLLVLQLIYGAFMAGLKAAIYAMDWPTINGQWWPDGLGKYSGLQDLTDNPITVQLIHRSLAYILTVCLLIWWWKARAIQSGWFAKSRGIIPLLVVVQVILGILTLHYSATQYTLIWLGTAHQFAAMLLLLAMVWMLYLLKGKSFVQP